MQIFLKRPIKWGKTPEHTFGCFLRKTFCVISSKRYTCTAIMVNMNNRRWNWKCLLIVNRDAAIKTKRCKSRSKSEKRHVTVLGCKDDKGLQEMFHRVKLWLIALMNCKHVDLMERKQIRKHEAGLTYQAHRVRKRQISDPRLRCHSHIA